MSTSSCQTSAGWNGEKHRRINKWSAPCAAWTKGLGHETAPASGPPDATAAVGDVYINYSYTTSYKIHNAALAWGQAAVKMQKHASWRKHQKLAARSLLPSLFPHLARLTPCTADWSRVCTPQSPSSLSSTPRANLQPRQSAAGPQTHQLLQRWASCSWSPRAGVTPPSEEGRLTAGEIPLLESQRATEAVITAAARLIYGSVLVKLSGGPRRSTSLHTTTGRWSRWHVTIRARCHHFQESSWSLEVDFFF